MENQSHKMVELFAGAEALNKALDNSLKINFNYEEGLKDLKKSLNTIYTPEVLEINKKIKETIAFNTSFAVPEISQRLSEILKQISSQMPDMSNLPKLYIEELRQHLNVVQVHQENATEQEKIEEREVNQRLLNEIYVPDQKKIITSESPVITVAPINDEVLCYLRDNPEEWYKLTGEQFEMVMQEIYTRLGYQVERTKATRDGGKDLIIRKPELLGDFIYYVECKKYAPNRHIGLGIVQRFKCVVDTDNVNGGMLATTSFFTKDARDFVLNNNLDCQVKFHDFNTINGFLNKVCM